MADITADHINPPPSPLSATNFSTWNCQSLGVRSDGSINPVKKAYVRQLIKKNRGLIILTETRHIQHEAKKIKWQNQMRTILHTPSRNWNQDFPQALQDTNTLNARGNLLPDVPEANVGSRGGGGIIIVASNEYTIMQSETLCRGHCLISQMAKNREKPFFLVAAYAPTGTQHQRTFWKQMEQGISDFILTHVPVNEAPQVHLIGDLNLDPENIADQETSDTIKRITDTWIMEDIGSALKSTEPTWHGNGERSHLNSRIDIMISSLAYKLPQPHGLWKITQESSPSDHDWITFSYGHRKSEHIQPTIQDFIIAKDEFLMASQDRIMDTMIHHSQEFLHNNATYEEMITRNSNPTKLEETIQWDEGTDDAMILNLIIKDTKIIYNQLAKREKNKKQEDIRKHTQSMREMYSKLQESTNQEERQSLKDDIRLEKSTRQDKVRMEENITKQRIDSFYREQNGKMTAATFAHTKPQRFKHNINKLIVEGKTITEEDEILEVMRAHLSDSIANPEKTQKKTLKDKFAELNIPHPAYHPEEDEEENATRDFSLDEIRDSLKSMQPDAAPGTTGTTRNFFLWLMTMIPITFTKGYNSFLRNHTNNPIFAWTKQRRIIFIPKPGKTPGIPSSYRPISLLETFYKIGAKLLAKEVGKITNSRVSKSQFGFIPKRTAAEASTYLQSIIKRAHRTKEPLQIVFLDAKSAFDLTTTEGTTEMMEHLGVPHSLINKINSLTNKGRFKIVIAGRSSVETEIQNGTGQGCPASASKFDINHEGNLIIYKNMNFPWALKVDGYQIDPSVFADDSAIPVKLRNAQDYQELINFFSSLSEMTGFTINNNKTEILAINTDENLIQEINSLNQGEIKHQVKHLGIILPANIQRLEEANVEYLLPRLEETTKRVSLRNHSTYTRALLIESILHSQANHILMAVKLNNDNTKRIQKIIHDALWIVKNQDDARIEGRKKIAKTRTHAPIHAGGLNMRPTELKIKCLYTDSGTRHFRKYFDEEHPQYIQNELRELLEPDLLTMGSVRIKKLSLKFCNLADIYQNTLVQVANIIEMLERSKDCWEASAIRGSIYDTPFPISDRENAQLISQDLTTVSQLFDTEEPRSLNNTINFNFAPNINIKLSNIAQNIKSKQTEFRHPTITKTHSHSFFKDKSINPSHILKKQEKRTQEDTWVVAPSRLTRYKEGIPVPDIHTYNAAYIRNKKSNFSEYQKSLNLAILNRTAWSNSKAFKSGKREDDNCDKCRGTETIEHMFLDCPGYAEPIWETMKQLITQCKSKPGITTISQDQIIYMKNISVLSKEDNEEAQEIMQEIKQVIYGSRMNERQDISATRRIAHIIKCIKKTISQREYNSKKSMFCAQMLEKALLMA